MKKLVYVFERRHAYQYDHDMFGYQYFLDQNFEIEIWSLVNWTFPDTAFPLNGSRGQNIHYISSPETLQNNLERVKEKDCYFIVYPYHGYTRRSYLLRKSIQDMGFRFSNLTESPTMGCHICRGNFLIEACKETAAALKIPACYLGGLLFNKATLKEKASDLAAALIGPYRARSDYNFVTTEAIYRSYPNHMELFSRRNVLLHSESYEEYLNLHREEGFNGYGKYVVFIDQFLTGHSDFRKYNRKMPIQDVKRYYEDLNGLFRMIEKDYQCEVIIAAHPKGEYTGDEFGGRRIIYGETGNLVRNAQLVLVQYSTAFGLIGLFGKDYLQFYTGEMFENSPNLRDIYSDLSGMCKSKALDIHLPEEVEKWKQYVKRYSEEDFREYKQTLLIANRSVAKNRSMFEVMASMISERGKNV